MSGLGASREARERPASRGALPSTAPSSITHPSPTRVPAWTVTCAPIVRSSPSSTPSPRCSPGASADGSSMRRDGAPRGLELALQALEDANDPQATLAVGDRRATLGDAL